MLPGNDVAEEERGAVLRGPGRIAGGSSSVNVKDARGFEVDLVGLREGEEARP